MQRNGTVIFEGSGSRPWLRFAEPVQVIRTAELDGVRPALEEIERAASRGLWAAGFLAYEAAPGLAPELSTHLRGSLPLLWFGLYERAEVIEPPSVSGEPSVGAWQMDADRTEYGQTIDEIHRAIADGDCYQVNLTQRLHAELSGDPMALATSLWNAQRGGEGAYVDIGTHAVCSASPELFLAIDGDRVTSRPMKGTRPRGLWSADDQAQANELAGSAKDRAENVMIVDMVRNDLGRVARTGTVDVPRLADVERYPTVWQLTSTVTATVDAPLTELLAATFPAASITGAPKRRSMQRIAELERSPRGVYCGTIGHLAPNRTGRFNVAIRTVTIDRSTGVAEYGVGGGIVWDSTAEDEWRECHAKAAVLTTPMPPDFSLLETLLWEPERGFWLDDRHRRRLLASAEYFDVPIAPESVDHALTRCIDGLTSAHRVRLLVARDGAIHTEVMPLPSSSADTEPWRLELARRPIDPHNRFLYHKTTHREVYESARAEHPIADDVLLWNPDGELTETTVANIVVERSGELVTPPVRCGLLPGTYREQLLAEGRIREAIIRRDEIAGGSRMWLINSVRAWIEAALAAAPGVG